MRREAQVIATAESEMRENNLEYKLGRSRRLRIKSFIADLAEAAVHLISEDSRNLQSYSLDFPTLCGAVLQIRLKLFD